MASMNEPINIDKLKADLWESAARILVERCEAAENYISLSPCDPDITVEQSEAYAKWQAIVKKNDQ
jgi:hypothetical protein